MPAQQSPTGASAGSTTAPETSTLGKEPARSESYGARLRSAPWLMMGALVLVALFLLPAREAALRGDDEWTFGFRGMLELTHRTLINQIGSDISTAIEHLRPQVLAKPLSDGALFYFDGHPALYRLYLVGLTVLCAGLLWALVRKLGASRAFAALIVVLFAAAVQFRSYHDPLLGYYGATQFALAFVLGSLSALLKSLNDGGRRWAVLAAVLFACGCGMQEYVYPLAAAHLGLALTQRRGRQAFLAALPVLVVGAVLMVVGYLGRNGLAGGQNAVPAGYGTALNPHRVLASYITQLFSPLPGSNRLFSESPIAYFYPLGSSPTPAELLAATWRGAVAFAAVIAFALGVGRSDGDAFRSSSGTAGRLAAVGVPLWITPPLLIAVSSKYQQELTPGKAYVEVLFQVVGFALLTAAVLLVLLEAAKRRSRAAFLVTAVGAAVLLAFGAAVDGFNNLRVVALEQPVRHTRDLLETAATNGVFQDLPTGSTLLFSAHDMDWPTGSWLYGATTGEAVLRADSGRSFDVRYAADQTPMTCAAGMAFPPPSCAPPERSSAWVRVRAQRNGGTVIVSRLLGATPATVGSQRTDDITVYVTQSGGSSPAPPTLDGSLSSRRSWSSGGVRWSKVRSGSGWAMYRTRLSRELAPVAYSLNDPSSPVDFLAPRSADQDARLFGTKQLLP